jgi:hypothetical protein
MINSSIHPQAGRNTMSKLVVAYVSNALFISRMKSCQLKPLYNNNYRTLDKYILWANMSKGMWTKHLTIDGNAYYYNAAKNISVWQPPIDSIIHEAPNLKPPTSTVQLYNKQF